MHSHPEAHHALRCIRTASRSSMRYAASEMTVCKDVPLFYTGPGQLCSGIVSFPNDAMVVMALAEVHIVKLLEVPQAHERLYIGFAAAIPN